MIKKPYLGIVQTPEPPTTTTRKDGMRIVALLMGVVLLGIGVSLMVNLLELNSKVDVADYPGAEKGSLSAKGKSFVNDKYTSDKPNSNYYKVRLTADSCQDVMAFYRGEATKGGWTTDGAIIPLGENILKDSYRKNGKGFFVYCAANPEQLAENAGSKNTILLLAADRVLEL